MRRGYMRAGFMIPEPRWKYSNLVVADTTATEAQPRPTGLGIPASSLTRLRLATSGEQDTDFDALVTHGGMPTRVSWKVSGEAVTAYRGQESCLQPMFTDHAEFDSSANNTWWCPSIALDEASQFAVVTYVKLTAAPSSFRYRRWDPTTMDWTGASGTLSSTPPGAQGGVGICWNPDNDTYITLNVGRTGAVYGETCMSSDGSTWAVRGTSVLPAAPVTSASFRSCRLAYLNGNILALCCTTAAGGTTYQFMSATMGTSYVTVATSVTVNSLEVAVTPGGMAIVVWLDSVTGTIYYNRLGSASQPVFTGGTQLAATVCSEATVVAEPNGRAWIFARTTIGQERWIAWLSLDEGATWARTAYGPFDYDDANDYVTRVCGVPMLGGLMLTHQVMDAIGTYDLSVGMIYMGGWSNWVDRYDTLSGAAGDIEYGRFGGGYATANAVAVTATPGVAWSSITGLVNVGGGAGTSAVEQAEKAWHTHPTAASFRMYRLNPAPGAATATAGEIKAEIKSTASIAGDPALATVNTYPQLLVAIDGPVNNCDVCVCWSGNGAAARLHVFDRGAGALLTAAGGVAVSLSTYCQIRLIVDTTTAMCYAAYKRRYETVWTRLYSGACNAAAAGIAPVGLSNIAFGNAANGASQNWFRLVSGWHSDDGAGTAISDPCGISDTPPVATWTMYGGPVDHRGLPFDVTSTYGTTVLFAAAGPGIPADSFDLDADSDFPVANVFPEVSPSQIVGWVSLTDQADQRIAVQPDTAVRATQLGRTTSPALFVSGATSRHVYLDARTGAGAWAQIVDVDLATGFTGLSGTFAGDTLLPAAGAVGARWLHADELVGGTAVITGGGNTAYCKILGNTEGVWRTTGRSVVIWLDTVTSYGGALPPAGAVTVELWAPAGVGIAHDVTTTAYDEWSVRITSPGLFDNTWLGAYMLTVASVGAFQPVGKLWKKGYLRDSEMVIRETENEMGSFFRSPRGPSRDRWTMAWTEGQDNTLLGQASPDPDYYSASAGGRGMVAWHDVAGPLASILTQQAHLPVVILPRVPGAGGTITDPDLFLWAYLDSPVSFEHLAGEPSLNEAGRIQSAAFKEVT